MILSVLLGIGAIILIIGVAIASIVAMVGIAIAGIVAIAGIAIVCAILETFVWAILGTVGYGILWIVDLPFRLIRTIIKNLKLDATLRKHKDREVKNETRRI